MSSYDRLPGTFYPTFANMQVQRVLPDIYKTTLKYYVQSERNHRQRCPQRFLSRDVMNKWKGLILDVTLNKSRLGTHFKSLDLV